MLKFLIFGSLCVLSVWGDECQKAHADVNKYESGLTSDCAKEMKLTPKEKVEKSTCVYKCMLVHAKVLTPDGALDKAQYQRHVKERYPASMHDKVTKHFDPCLGLPVDASKKDDYCTGYDPLIKCLNEKLANLCSS